MEDLFRKMIACRAQSELNAGLVLARLPERRTTSHYKSVRGAK
jgi:hypothetical protein